MNPVLVGQLAGQARHVMTGLGWLGAGTGAAADDVTVLAGSVVVALVGHIWSWIVKKR